MTRSNKFQDEEFIRRQREAEKKAAERRNKESMDRYFGYYNVCTGSPTNIYYMINKGHLK